MASACSHRVDIHGDNFNITLLKNFSIIKLEAIMFYFVSNTTIRQLLEIFIILGMTSSKPLGWERGRNAVKKNNGGEGTYGAKEGKIWFT
jgi:hypothetical protein